MGVRPAFRCVFGFLLLSMVLWGREFRAQASEATVPSQLLVRLRVDATPDTVFSSLGSGVRVRPLGRMNLHVVDLPAGARSAATSRLAGHPLVEYVEPNRIRRTTVEAPNDPRYARDQWALQTVQALKAWSLLPNRYLSGAAPVRGRIKVAVLDTGADCTHPDFQNLGGSSTDSALGGQFSFQESQAFVNTTIASPACSWQDDFGHGTHVAGIIAAAANNATGVAGLGYAVQLLVYKVLDAKGFGRDSDIASAIMAAADAGAAVISLSLGGSGYSQTLQDAVTYAWQRNILVVAAAGNGGSNEPFFPGSANHVLCVAASDGGNNRAAFSNYGDSVDIAAPGVSILSTAPTYPVTQAVADYAYYSGTSMAAPHVSALGGLMAMANPGVSAEAIAQRIQQSAVSAAGDGGWGPELGYGVMNAWRAISGQPRPASTGGLVGQVVDFSGMPVTGATIQVGQASVTTDSTGLFRIANQPAGTYPIKVAAHGFPDQALTATVPPGADTGLTLTMGVALGALTGTVTGDGSPLAGAIVEARAGGLIQATAAADALGRYWLAVPAGTYDVRASALSFLSATVPGQSVAAAGARTADIALAKMGWITGVVMSADGHPVANAQVDVTAEGFAAGAVTDETGSYATLGLPAGNYVVAASLSGLPTTTMNSVWVGASAPTKLDLNMSGATQQAPPAADFTAIRVNSGGPAYTDSENRLWSADYGYSGGNVYATPVPIAATATPGIYQTERYGPLQYQFPVPNGMYTVKLHFAEICFSKPGQRVFGVAINGQPALGNFDIVAEAGGPNIALDKTIPVWVTDGQITIELIPLIENPKISGLEIY